MHQRPAAGIAADWRATPIVFSPLSSLSSSIEVSTAGIFGWLSCHWSSFIAPYSTVDLHGASEVIDMRVLMAFSAFLLSTVTALAEVGADCRSTDPAKAISGCTVFLQNASTSKADQAFAYTLRADAFISQKQFEA